MSSRGAAAMESKEEEEPDPKPNPIYCLQFHDPNKLVKAQKKAKAKPREETKGDESEKESEEEEKKDMQDMKSFQIIEADDEAETFEGTAKKIGKEEQNLDAALIALLRVICLLVEED